MTRVLIAVDHSEEATDAAHKAHELFGDDASYLVVNVMDHNDGRPGAWGHVYPLATPLGIFPVTTIGPIAAVDQPSTAEDARQTATEVADEAELGAVDTLGMSG